MKPSSVAEEILLISQSKNNYVRIVFFLILAGAFMLFFAIASVIFTSWLFVVATLLDLLLALTLIAKFFRKRYLFYQDRIVIENYRKKYLGEIRISDITGWNKFIVHSKIERHVYLGIKTSGAKLIIEGNNYRNFEAFIDYFKRSGIQIDERLNDPLIVKGKYPFPIDKNTFGLFMVLSVLTLTLFWSIIRTKSDSCEKLFFTGKITDICFNRRNVHLTIDTHKNFVFSTTDKRFFVATRYKNGKSVWANEGKTISLGVFKSDYDWLVNNKLVRKIYIASKISLPVAEYKILD